LRNGVFGIGAVEVNESCPGKPGVGQ
jgi:hypothetical protein